VVAHSNRCKTYRRYQKLRTTINLLAECKVISIAQAKKLEADLEVKFDQWKADNRAAGAPNKPPGRKRAVAPVYPTCKRPGCGKPPAKDPQGSAYCSAECAPQGRFALSETG
jgi:hypothetical protein